MEIKQYDMVRLKDGGVGDIMEIYGAGESEVYLITVGDDEQGWEDIDATKDDIEEVI